MTNLLPTTSTNWILPTTGGGEVTLNNAIFKPSSAITVDYIPYHPSIDQKLKDELIETIQKNILDELMKNLKEQRIPDPSVKITIDENRDVHMTTDNQNTSSTHEVEQFVILKWDDHDDFYLQDNHKGVITWYNKVEDATVFQTKESAEKYKTEMLIAGWDCFKDCEIVGFDCIKNLKLAYEEYLNYMTKEIEE